jgi:hypothetical protein
MVNFILHTCEKIQNMQLKKNSYIQSKNFKKMKKLKEEEEKELTTYSSNYSVMNGYY